MRGLRTVVAPFVAIALVLAACGGDDEETGAATAEETAEETGGESAEPTAEPTAEETAEPTAEETGGGETGGATGEAPSGEPLKVMTVTTLNAAGPTYQNIANTANAYADYINARGGIAGRPLEVTVCDEQFDPAVATTCARQAVEEGMVSIVGSFTFFAESIVPVIAESSITWFGPCCAITPSELTSPYSFPIGNQPMYAVGAVKRAVDDGCTNINAVVIDGAQVFLPPMENAMKALGKEFGATVILPPTAQDYSAEVAQATDGADCVVAVISAIFVSVASSRSADGLTTWRPKAVLATISVAPTPMV